MANNTAKKHPSLVTLSQELRGLRVSQTFQVYGHDYTLGLLSPRDDDWINEKASASSNIFSYASLMSKPRVAASLMAIDGLSMAELFQLPDEPDMEAATKKLLQANPELFADWLRGEVFKFVLDDMDALVIKELDNKLGELDRKKEEALKKIGPLSKTTPLSA